MRLDGPDFADFWAIEELFPCKIIKIWPRPVTFSLRFFKSDRLLALFEAIHQQLVAGDNDAAAHRATELSVRGA